MPGGLIAKLHSFDDSNSIACLSFITLRTNSTVCCGLNAVLDTGVILPSTLSAGGKPAVMNRSEPFCLTSRSRRSWMNLVALARSIVCSGLRPEEILVRRPRSGFGQVDLVAANQLGQVLVERL